jgi:hypothetical protein
VATFTVTAQRHVTRLNAAQNGAEDGMQVVFTYGSPPQEGQVFVPGEQPDPELAERMIADYVDKALAIQSLGQGGSTS